jgi:hypothetical protein
VLYAEETTGGIVEHVYIDLESIPRSTLQGQRMLISIKKLFNEARKAKEPTYGFREGDFGYVYQAERVLAEINHNDIESPTLFDGKAASKVKAVIEKKEAHMPCDYQLLQEVADLCKRLGLADEKMVLKGNLSKEMIFNTSSDPRLSLPGKLILHKGEPMRTSHYNPSLLFATQAIYSNAGNDKAYSDFRAHPLAKLASMVNQLFGLTVIHSLNVMAQLVAIALNSPLSDVCHQDARRLLLYHTANKLDSAMRHVLFAYKFSFLKFVKVPALS